MFIGQTYQLSTTGKFNANENVDDIEAGDFIDGSRNIDSHNGGIEKRGGTVKVNTNAISGNPTCLGLGQLITSSGSKYRYFVGNDGKIYRDETSVKTSLSTTAKAHLAPIGDAMFIANGTDIPQVDTGAAIANITTSASDWSGSSQPAVFVLHNRGAARRAWAVNVTGFKNKAYYSSLGALQTFNGGTAGTVNVDIQEGNGIVTAVEFAENLLFLGRKETYILQDDSTDIATWGVYKAGWTGGVYSPRLLCKTPNDIICMMEDGEIYSVSRAEQVRDYKLASIARPSFIHNWIRNNIDLTSISKFHMSYDPKIKAIRIWMVRLGQSNADVCLKYYVFEDVWGSPDDALENSNDSGFYASASCTMNISTGEERCCTGDYNGFIWKVSDTTKSDDGAAYKSVCSTSWLTLDLPRDTKRFVRALVNYLSRGAYIVTVQWFLDGNAQTTASVDVGGVGGAYGSAIYGTSVYSVVGIEESEVTLGNIGRKVRFEISNNGAGEDFFISYLLIDFIRMGAKVK